MRPPHPTREHVLHHIMLLGQGACGAAMPPAPMLSMWMIQDYLPNLWACVIQSNQPPGHLGLNTREVLPF